MDEDNSAEQRPAKPRATAPSRNDSVTAGPALAAAACPVNTKMPAPMIAPIPRATRSSADNERLGRRTPSSPRAASMVSSSVDFFAHKFVKGGNPLNQRLI